MAYSLKGRQYDSNSESPSFFLSCFPQGSVKSAHQQKQGDRQDDTSRIEVIVELGQEITYPAGKPGWFVEIGEKVVIRPKE